ncbi:MAG: cohesin domain-containing protein, partial [Bacteroidia bacterium]
MNDFFTYNRFLLYFRAILLMIFFVNQGKAQNITATIGSFNSTTCAVGDTLVLPVSTVMGSGISVSAISLAIDYDSTKLQCISTVTGLNSAISAGFLSNCGLFSNQSPNAPYNATTRRQFRAAWFALTPVNVNGVMFNLRFRVLATGNTSINWDVATPGNCEFADEIADVIPNISWVNSTIVCGTAAPCTPPLASITAAGPTTFCQGSSVVLNANTGTGLTYQWALNGTNISGATNASYTATIAGSHTVVVSNAPNCSTVSNATSVTVTTPPSAGTLSGNQAVCVAGTTTFASTVSGGSWS